MDLPSVYWLFPQLTPPGPPATHRLLVSRLVYVPLVAITKRLTANFCVLLIASSDHVLN